MLWMPDACQPNAPVAEAPDCPENRGVTAVACTGFVLYKARVEKIGWHSGSVGGDVPGEVSSKLSGSAANEG
jgi:hypothetical protein